MAGKSERLIRQQIKQGLRPAKEGFASPLNESDTVVQLQKKLAEAQQKVKELESKKYPDEDKIERAMGIVAQLKTTLKNEGIDVR